MGFKRVKNSMYVKMENKIALVCVHLAKIRGLPSVDDLSISEISDYINHDAMLHRLVRHGSLTETAEYLDLLEAMDRHPAGKSKGSDRHHAGSSFYKP